METHSSGFLCAWHWAQMHRTLPNYKLFFFFQLLAELTMAFHAIFGLDCICQQVLIWHKYNYNLDQLKYKKLSLATYLPSQLWMPSDMLGSCPLLRKLLAYSELFHPSCSLIGQCKYFSQHPANVDSLFSCASHYKSNTWAALSLQTWVVLTWVAAHFS